MSSFEDYSDSFGIACDPELVDFCMKEQEYCIFEGSKPLITPGGNSFSHQSENVIRLIVTDLQLFNCSTLKELSSPVLYSFRKDIFDAGKDPFLQQWENQLAGDPFVLIKTCGRSAIHPFSPDDPLFTFAFISLTGLIGIVNDFAGKVMSEVIMEESDAHPFPELLWLSYGRLSADEKVAVQALSSVHHSGIVMPLLLVSGEIGPVEYVKGLISLKIQPKELFSENLAGVARVQAYLGLLMQKPHQERPTAALIREGEGGAIEFKSTLRWDIRAGKTNPAIERACLKTISAFLNSKGGSLLIGVCDDGSIEGIETDKFVNEDKFLLHLWTLIRICLGRDFSPYISTRLQKMEEKTVCVVDCLPSNRPVFLRQPGFDEEMYIRVGPSSNALDISEALKYIEDHFPGK
ncbi:MAG: ATP-binding protein [Bacteroidia bacterium]|nr:ATP-binding protein [Bacteroidia bacterium]